MIIMQGQTLAAFWNQPTRERAEVEGGNSECDGGGLTNDVVFVRDSNGCDWCLREVLVPVLCALL